MNTTKTAQFTPGPYELRGSRLLTDSNGVVLADNIGANWPGTIEGQANLFAAAPAMYEALQIMVRAANVDEIDPLVMFASIERARHVLKLAEGKSA